MNMVDVPTELQFPIYYCERNMQLKNWLDLNCVSHFEMSRIITDNGRLGDINKIKKKIDRFCSFTHPQKITDSDWDKIQGVISQCRN